MSAATVASASSVDVAAAAASATTSTVVPPLEALRAIVDDWRRTNVITERQAKFCDDKCLGRYIQAYEGNVSLCAKYLKETLEWREQYKPDEISITEPDIAEFAKSGFAYVYGKDKQNRPIIHLNIDLDIVVANTTEMRHKKLRYAIYLLELAIEKAEELGADQWVVMIDLKGGMGASMDDIPFMRQFVAPILNNYYCERLAYCFVVNPPFLFSTIWNVLKRFMDASTVAKYKFVSLGGKSGAGREAQLKQITEFIDASQLEARFFGESKFVYSYDEAVREEQERRRSSRRQPAAAAAAAGDEASAT